MKLYQTVFKDVMRRKRRVLYATVGVIVGTMTVVGLLTVAQAGQDRIYKQLEKYGPNITVVPAIESVNMSLGDLTLGTISVGENLIPQDKLAMMQQIADNEIRKALKLTDSDTLATIAPKLYMPATIKGSSLMLVGVQPAVEQNVKTWWKVTQGKYLEEGDQALVGAAAARLLNLNIGDQIPVKQGQLTVTGILEDTGSSEDYQVFVPLDTLQGLYGKQGLISSVDIRALCNACPASYIADSINRDITGVRAVAVKQVAETEMGMLEKIRQLMLALAGVTLLVGGFGVVNTLMTSVHERTKDIGIMRAVGASRGQIIMLFIYEAVIIGVLGGLIGYVLGTALAYAIGPLIFEGSIISILPMYLPISLGLAIIIAVLATLYPAYRATRIRVADSFRST